MSSWAVWKVPRDQELSSVCSSRSYKSCLKLGVTEQVPMLATNWLPCLRIADHNDEVVRVAAGHKRTSYTFLSSYNSSSNLLAVVNPVTNTNSCTHWKVGMSGLQ